MISKHMETHRERLAPGSALFPTRVHRELWGDLSARELAFSSQRIGKGAVTPTLDLARFGSDLTDFDFLTPRAMDELLSWFIAHLEHGIVHVTVQSGSHFPGPVRRAQLSIHS
jgi:hypothetical protein